MLARAGLGDQAGLAHLFGQQGLAQHIVDLVGAGMVQVLPLQVDLRPAQVLCHFLRIVQPGGPAGVFIEQRPQLPVELRVVFIVVVRFLQLDHRIHQRLRDVLAAVDAKASVLIGHGLSPSGTLRTARTNAVILFSSFRPSVSMPELTSTP